MARKIFLGSLAALILVACSRAITQEQYVAAMAALGCKNMTEKSAGAAQVLKEEGVAEDQIIVFRKKMDPKTTTDVSMEIARRVMECHGVRK
jgi:hypothetical protein